MNLIQIQERLKEFPLNAIISYANGSNPEVPPYLALAEIQRRNKVQESSQSATPPDSSVKEQIERKAMEQGANQLMADQARQQQASQQMAQQMAQPSEQVPPNVPQPQEMETVPTYAGGGIASVPVGNMFNFDSGGIVAFADGDYVTDPFGDKPKEEKPRTRSVQPKKQEPPKGAPRTDYLQESERRIRELAIPEMESPQQALARAAKTTPALQQPVGAGYEAVLQKLAQQDEANQRAFEEREKATEGRSLSQALIEAGEATRGGGGIGSLLGGFGRSRIASGEAAKERQARQEALRREQSLNMAKLNSEIENARRAEARGDVEAERKHLENVAKLRLDLGMKQADLFKDLYQAKSLGNYYEGTLENQREANRRMGAQATPEFVKMFNFFKQRNPKLTDEQAYELAAKSTRAGITGEYSGERANAQIIQKIQKDFMTQIAMARQAGDKAREQILTDQMNDAIRRATGGIPGAAPPVTPQGGTGWGKAEVVGKS